MRSSFDYAVVSPDGKRLLGCVYVDPPEKAGYDAEAYYWARRDGPERGLEEELGESTRRWIPEAWPFENVAYPGRDISWEDYDALPGRGER
jgi:hypothetical protein